MDREQIRSLTRMSLSLWGSSERAFAMSEETLTSVSLFRLSTERTIERAMKTLIERAEQSPKRVLALHHPFYRLAPVERFLLTALHIEKWSYERIARVLRIEISLIETLSWASRLKLCFQEMNLEIEYPKAPTTLGPMCPEYDLSKPWTQKLLDDELGKRERNYLQSHLMTCSRCVKSLAQTRKLFFKIETFIPASISTAETEVESERIYRSWKAGESAFRPILTTFEQSLVCFLNQPRIQISLAALTLFFFFWSKHI